MSGGGIGVRTRSKTPHQTGSLSLHRQPKLRTRGPYSLHRHKEYTRSQTKNPFGAQMLSCTTATGCCTVLHQLEWKFSLLSTGNICNTRKPNGESANSHQRQNKTPDFSFFEMQKKLVEKGHQPWVCLHRLYTGVYFLSCLLYSL